MAQTYLTVRVPKLYRLPALLSLAAALVVVPLPRPASASTYSYRVELCSKVAHFPAAPAALKSNATRIAVVNRIALLRRRSTALNNLASHQPKPWSPAIRSISTADSLQVRSLEAVVRAAASTSFYVDVVSFVSAIRYNQADLSRLRSLKIRLVAVCRPNLAPPHKTPAPGIPAPPGHHPALPYVGTDYGSLYGPPPPARIVTDGFVSCTFPNDVYYYIKYSTGYSQLTQVHYTNIGSVYWVMVDSWGKLLPYSLAVSYTTQNPPTGIHYGTPEPGCSYWKSS